MLKAILFDLDDTLIDWSQRSQDWADVDRMHLTRVFDYVRQNLHPLKSHEEFYNLAWQLTMQSWEDAKKSLKAPHLGEVLVQTCVDLGVPREILIEKDLLKAYDWRPFPGVVPFPDSLEILPQIHRYGLKVGLITNAYQPIELRDRELQAFGLIDHIPDCRFSAADVGMLKPHPAIFEAALDCLEISPEEGVFVGDSLEADIAGAQSVGMRAILRIIPGMEETHAIMPDAKIKSLQELFPILDDWYPGWR